MGSSSSMGSYKVNTSGISRGNQNGYGGILRDENGCWKRGFMGHLQSGKKRIDAELWAVFKGVELIDSLRLQNTTLETDSLSVIDLLEEPDPYTESISDCQKLIKKNGITLSFITPEKNKCAGFLAKLAMKDDDDEYEDVLDPPPGIECSYKVNTSGVSRGIYNGYGGILRDENGCWKRGFMGHLQSGERHIDAELWAMFKGVKLIDSLRLQNTTLETDSLSVIDILEEPDSYTGSSFFKEYISDCQKLIKKNGITLCFITPERNKCAEFLAKLSMEDEYDDEYEEDVLDPPLGIECHILADKGNVTYD